MTFAATNDEAMTAPLTDPDARAVRHAQLDRSKEPVLGFSSVGKDGERVEAHRHNRHQLLYALAGLVTVKTDSGRWMMPAGYALWIPAETVHSVDLAGDVQMRSIYVRPGAAPGLPVHLHVAALTPLMRALVGALCALPNDGAGAPRAAALAACLLQEVPFLEEKPLSLPFPADPRLARLCQAFMRDPSQPVAVEDWALSAGMSRRSFTRFFRRQTGLSLTTWRQQACLMAALPRLAAGEPVTNVAFGLGYESSSAFTTMFRRMLGAAPRDYLSRTI